MSEVETKTVSKKKRMNVKDLTTMGLLTGILLVMAFTPLGYFHTLGVDISLMMIPVAIGAMLMGFMTGVIFLLVSKLDKKKTVCYFVGGFFAAFLNTVFFMATLILLFWNTEYIQGFNTAFGGVNPFLCVVMFVGVNGMLEWPASCIAGGVVSKAVSRTLYKKVV